MNPNQHKRPKGTPQLSYEDHVSRLGGPREKSMGEEKALARDRDAWL